MRLHPIIAVLAAGLFLGLAHIPPASAAGAIVSGQTVGGSVTSPSYSEVWTFTGTTGHRIVIAASPTSGTLTTRIRLSNPSSAEVLNTTANQVDYQLLATGTFTLTIQDAGLNHTGSYNLTLIDVTTGPLTYAGDADGGPIASAAVVTGQVNAISDMDAFTFAGTAGDRVILGALAVSGPSFDATMTLYPPGGGAVEALSYGGSRLDTKLAASGTYTVVVSDYSVTHTGGYTLAYLNLTAGPLTSVADPDGGTITSAQVKSGQFQTTTDFDAYRFIGTAGDRILIATAPTGGTSTPLTYLYPPGGGAPVVTTGSNRTDYQLLTSGTYTLLIEDSGLNDTGSYDLSLLDVTSGPWTTASDTDGTSIFSSGVVTGQMNADVDFDAYTFSGAAGDRVVIGALATSGSGFNTNITLYPPGGGAAEAYSYSGDRLDVQLLQSGFYTVVIEDYALTHTGTYSLSFVNLTEGPLSSVADPDGGTIASGQVKIGQFQSTPDFDVYRFTSGAGNRVLIDAVPTGGTANPLVYIYPPGGGAPVVTSGAHRVEYQTLVAGTYSVLLEDSGLNDTGTYDLSLLNVTAGPLTTSADPDGGAIASTDVKTGQINYDVDFDAFTFGGSMGDRVLIGAVTSSGTGFNTTITLYPPGGGPAEALSYSADRLDTQLQQSGTYTIVIEDYSNAHTGAYSLSLLDLTAGPLTSAADPDGGTIASGEIKSGQFQTTPDFDAYRLSGNVGDRMIMDVVPTGGTANPYLYLYPPNGGAPVVASGSHRVEYQLLQAGTYSLLVQDGTLANPGTYDLTLLNVTSGPLTTVTDPDGGPIASAGVKTGQISGGVDMDAFTFTGAAGDRVLIGAVATGGGLQNTTTTLYPPGGGPPEALSYGADRLDTQLQLSGTYTIVVEDYSNAHPGAYSLSLLDVTSGPLTSVADADGGILQPGDLKLGQFQTAPDFDAFRFDGAFGDTVRITTAATSGPVVPLIAIYPPTGQALLTTTQANVTYLLPSRSIFTLVIQDQTLSNTGSYSIHFQKTGGITGVPGGTRPGVLALDPASPNPFTGSTDVGFSLQAEGSATLRVFDVRGARVATLADGRFAAGHHDARWDGRDARGGRAPSGVYWAELRAGDGVLRRRLVRVL